MVMNLLFCPIVVTAVISSQLFSQLLVWPEQLAGKLLMDSKSLEVDKLNHVPINGKVKLVSIIPFCPYLMHVSNPLWLQLN